MVEAEERNIPDNPLYDYDGTDKCTPEELDIRERLWKLPAYKGEA